MRTDFSKLGLAVNSSRSATLHRRWNLILITEAKNMAALDAVEAKWDAVNEKVARAEDKRTAEAVKRSEIRKIVGGKLLRELLLK